MIFSFLMLSCDRNPGGTQPDGDGAGDDNDVVELELPLSVTIIGDSYSTFEGWNNAGGNGFAVYYPKTSVLLWRDSQFRIWEILM